MNGENKIPLGEIPDVFVNYLYRIVQEVISESMFQPVNSELVFIIKDKINHRFQETKCAKPILRNWNLKLTDYYEYYRAEINDRIVIDVNMYSQGYSNNYDMSLYIIIHKGKITLTDSLYAYELENRCHIVLDD